MLLYMTKETLKELLRILRWGNYSRGPSVITRVCVCERGKAGSLSG